MSKTYSMSVIVLVDVSKKFQIISYVTPVQRFIERNQKQMNLHTSVGPAYIMGEGKMASTVDLGSKTPSVNTATCCSILVGRGTSSSFVQPPRGCSRSTGFLCPRSTRRFFVSYNTAW